MSCKPRVIHCSRDKLHYLAPHISRSVSAWSLYIIYTIRREEASLILLYVQTD